MLARAHFHIKLQEVPEMEHLVCSTYTIRLCQELSLEVLMPPHVLKPCWFSRDEECLCCRDAVEDRGGLVGLLNPRQDGGTSRLRCDP